MAIQLRTLRIVAAFTAAASFSAFAQTAPYFPPAGTWAKKSPSELGMDPAALASAVAYAQSRESERALDFSDQEKTFGSLLGSVPTRRARTNGVVIYKGYVVAEFGETTAVDPTYSVAKSMLATVAGVAVRDGRIAVNDPVSKQVMPGGLGTVPTGDSPLILGGNIGQKIGGQSPAGTVPIPADGGYASAHNAKITWKMHLQQESEWEGDMWGKKDDFIGATAFGAGERKPRERKAPGSFYEYNDVRINRFALSLLRAFDRSVPEVFEQEVMGPIGASNSWKWVPYHNSYVEQGGRRMASVSGGTRWGGGMWINSWDMARFGYLWLRGGTWDGKAVLPASYVKEALTPSANGPDYGYLWWLNTKGKNLPGLPANAYAALGAGNNTITVSPDHDLVIVWRWHAGNAAEFAKRVVAAIR